MNKIQIKHCEIGILVNKFCEFAENNKSLDSGTQSLRPNSNWQISVYLLENFEIKRFTHETMAL